MFVFASMIEQNPYCGENSFSIEKEMCDTFDQAKSYMTKIVNDYLKQYEKPEDDIHSQTDYKEGDEEAKIRVYFGKIDTNDSNLEKIITVKMGTVHGSTL